MQATETGWIPMDDRVAVKLHESAKETEGGIVLPDMARDDMATGVVVGIGRGAIAENGTIVPLDLEKGDVVLISKFGGVKQDVDGEELIILRQADILMKRVGS